MNNNLILRPVIRVIDAEINKLKDSSSDSKKLICQTLRRSKKLIESINIYNAKILGMSFEEFCDYIDSKNNILFLTYEELKRVNSALNIYDVVKEKFEK